MTEKPKSRLRKEQDAVMVGETPKKNLATRLQTKKDIVILATPPKLQLSWEHSEFDKKLNI
jgi:hypothetical protein